MHNFMYAAASRAIVIPIRVCWHVNTTVAKRGNKV